MCTIQSLLNPPDRYKTENECIEIVRDLYILISETVGQLTGFPNIEQCLYLAVLWTGIVLMPIRIWIRLSILMPIQIRIWTLPQYLHMLEFQKCFFLLLLPGVPVYSYIVLFFSSAVIVFNIFDSILKFSGKSVASLYIWLNVYGSGSAKIKMMPIRPYLNAEHRYLDCFDSHLGFLHLRLDPAP
jgi:hypothetical protein